MRLFSDKQKKILFIQSKGFCQICKSELNKGWHADHIKPYSKGGKTIVSNGQTLCPACNLKKSDKMKLELKPRGWQLKANERVCNKLDAKAKTALVVAGVGSGKTIFAQMFTNEKFKKKVFDNVVIVSPTENIKYNWASTFEKYFDIPIDFKYNFKYHFNQDYKGISITYKSLESEFNYEVLKGRINERTLIIVDEVHHAGDTKSWGEGLLNIGENAGFILLLSGTPTRSDNSKIPFVDYTFDSKSNLYSLNSDFEYTYSDSVKDLICCPVKFTSSKSEFGTMLGDINILDRDTQKNDASKYLRKLLKVTDEECYVYKTWKKGNEELNIINDSTNKDHAGLVICNSIGDAKRLYNLILKNYGPDFVELVHSDDKDSSKKINNFKESNKSWIVSVNMVSEGVDIPRIRTIVYMTNVTTFLYFMQVLGRGVRNYDKNLHNIIDVCQILIPDYKPLLDNAEIVEKSIRHIVDNIKKEIKERGPNGPMDEETLFDDVLYASSEDNGAIFKGDHINKEAEEFARKLAIQNSTSIETVLNILKSAKAMPGVYVKEEKKPVFISMTEKKKAIKTQIHKSVGRIALEFGKEFKEIHWQLNSNFGKSTNELSFGELQEKLRLAGDLYNKLNPNK